MTDHDHDLDLAKLTEERRASLQVSTGNEPDSFDFGSFVPEHLRVEPPTTLCACGESARPWEQTCRDCGERAERARRADEERLALRSFLDRSVPRHYADAQLGDEAMMAARVRGGAVSIAAMREHLREPWVTFVGPSGSGKTTLAVAGLRARVEVTRAEWWRILPAFRLGNARIQHPAGKGEHPLVELALRAPFVLLDDIGQEVHTANNPIAEIIQERDAEDRPTWITTGLSRADLGNRYGGGVARRILERSKLVKLGGVRPSEAPQISAPAYDVTARRAGDA